jgi:environmental stress-induced protein Ves
VTEGAVVSLLGASSLGIVRSGDREATPWRNGRGSTREIARRLLGVRGPHFVWRVSVAELVGDCELATFPGVERSATLIDGDGLVLDVAGVTHELGPYQTVRFDAEAQTRARLTRGAVRILNVMTVSSRMSARVEVVDLSTDRPLTIAGTTLVVLLSGEASVYAADGASGTLAPLDALVARPRVRLVSGTGRAAVVRLENFRAWRAFSW